MCYDQSYPTNMGSFGVVAHNFNKALKAIGHYSDADNADWVGICDGLAIGSQYKNKHTFILHVWDCINSLPNVLVNNQRISNQKIVGLSNQISKLWNKYNVPCETVMPGCDTEFWRQTQEKNKEFTFIFNSFGNVRSGLDLAICAFEKAFSNKKHVKLIIKNTGSSEKLKNIITKLKEKCNIEFIDERITFSELRDLYSKSHCSLNVMRHSSWGLNIHEAAACGCIPIVGNFCPSNEIVNSEYALFLEPTGEIDIKQKSKELVDRFGLHNAYGNFEYNEAPRFYDYSVEQYSSLLSHVSQMTETYKLIETRKPIVDNWSWEKSAKRLIEVLSK